MSTQDRLLSDEELVQQLKQVYRDGYYSSNNTDTDNFKAHLYWFKEYIDTQKRLYAETVIGEDENIPNIGSFNIPAVHAKVRDELRAEQRSRNNA